MSRNTPASSRFDSRVSALDRQQLLLAVLTHADHDQQADLRVLAEPHGDVDAVHEHAGVAGEPEVALAEPVVVLLPLLAHPCDRRRRQTAASSPSSCSSAA
jgi:hypothetical protein